MKKKNILIIFIVSLILCCPLLSSKFPAGHDTLYHAANIQCIKNMLLNFNFSKISGIEIAKGFGYGGSIFYPKFPHYIMAVFSIFVGTIKSMKIASFLTFFCSGIMMFKLLKHFFKNEYSSLLGAIAYMSTPYFVGDMYIRGAFNEFFIFVFMPMIFISLIEMLNNKKYLFYIFFILGYYLLINSHLVMAVYFTFYVLIYIIINYKKYLKKEYIKQFFIASTIVLLLASPFLTLMIQHKETGLYGVFNSDIMNATVERVKTLAITPKLLFLPTKMKTFDLIFFISPVVLLLLLVSIVKIFDEKNKEKRRNYLIFSFLSILSLFMSSRYFPYEYMPKILLSIQFAYRNISFLSFFIILLITYGFDKLRIKKNDYLIILFIIGIMLFPLYYANNSNNTISSYFYQFDEYAGMGAQKEYLPVSTIDNISYFNNRDNSIINMTENNNVSIEILNNKNNEFVFKVTNKNNDNVKLELPKIYYLGYKIVFSSDNNKKIVNYEKSDNGFIMIKNNKTGIYLVSYSGTTEYNIMRIIRLIFIIILLFYITKTNKKIIIKKIKGCSMEIKKVINLIIKKIKKIFKKFKFFDIFVMSAKFMLLFITMLLIITSLLFIINITVSKYHFIIIFLISAFVYYLYCNKKELKMKSIFTSIVLTILILISSIFISSKIYDTTADGNTYHKLAVGALKNGWNPVYQSVGDFNKKQGNPFDIYKDNVNIKWVDHYAKGTELFASIVYSFTNNIESGKCYNFLWLYIGLFIIFDILIKHGLSKWKSIIISFILVFNPIILVQLTNYYLDGVLAISLFIIILGSLIKNKGLKKNDEIDIYIYEALSLVWCINCKFTGLAFSAVFCGIIYLYHNLMNYIYDRNKFKTFIIKETIFYIIVVFVSVVIVGSSSYMINTIKHGNPLYPLYGKGHVENMVLKEMPKTMHNKSNVEIFLTSIFSKSENCSPSYSDIGNEPDLKVPFTFSGEEINNFNIPDMRIGGFGSLFSGIVLITTIGFIAMIVLELKKKKIKELFPILLVSVTALFLIILLDGSYWARYIPYFYLLPVLVLIYYFNMNNKIINKICILVVLLFIMNSGMIIYTQIKTTRTNNEYVSTRLKMFKEYSSSVNNVEIKLSHHGIQGVLYNLDDIKVDNYILVDDTKENDVYMFNY